MVFAGISEDFLAVLPWIRLRGSGSIYTLVDWRFYATQTPMQEIVWGFEHNVRFSLPMAGVVIAR